MPEAQHRDWQGMCPVSDEQTKKMETAVDIHTHIHTELYDSVIYECHKHKTHIHTH